MNEKELIEKRNTKVEEMEKIVNTAKVENRVITAEETERFNKLKEEIAEIDNTLAINKEMANFGLKEVKGPELTQEEKDIKDFANLIRKFNSGETQMTKGDNGAVIPSTIVKKIVDTVLDISPLLSRASRYDAKGQLIIPKVDTTTDDVTVDYATEFSELVEKSNKFASVTLTGFLVGGLVKISKSLLNNSDFKLVDFVVKRLAQKFKIFYEGEALNGTANKILGIAKTYDTTNMKIQLAHKSSVDADELIDIQEAVPDDYQENACWIMNRDTRKAIRKLKDGEGNYLLNRVFGEKWNYELLGKPVFTSCKVDKLGTANKNAIFYGDMSGLAVKFVEDMEITVMYEKFATQHAIGVCGYSEFDAKVENTQKIAVAVTGSTDPTPAPAQNS